MPKRYFNSSAFTEKPAIMTTALEVLETVYEKYLASDDGTATFATQPEPTQTEINNRIDAFYPQIIGSTKPVVIDVETWYASPAGGYTNIAGHQAAALKYSSLLAKLRVKLPGTPIIFYGLLPLSEPYNSWQAHGSSEYLGWQARNDCYAALATEVDGCAPEMYIQNLVNYSTIVAEHASEMRRLAPGKPGYPYIWMQWNVGSATEFQFFSGADWKTQLDEIEANFDGFVLWGGYTSSFDPVAFDPTLAWWIETRRHLGERGQIKVRYR